MKKKSPNLFQLEQFRSDRCCFFCLMFGQFEYFFSTDREPLPVYSATNPIKGKRSVDFGTMTRTGQGFLTIESLAEGQLITVLSPIVTLQLIKLCWSCLVPMVERSIESETFLKDRMIIISPSFSFLGHIFVSCCSPLQSINQCI